MTKTLKKLLAALLCAALLLPCAGAALQANARTDDYATVYVRGATDIYKYNEDGSRFTLYENGEYIEAIMKDAAPLLPGSMLTGNYDAYAAKVLEIMKPAFDPFRPSLEDGSVPADTHVDWSWDEESVRRDGSRKGYYEYFMDERLSPFVVAADLHEFIETVKAVSGKEQILLYSRCLGPVAAMTYLYEYERENDYAGIFGVMLSFSTHAGMALSDAAYTGTVNIPSDAVDLWLNSADTSDFSADEERLINGLLTGIANSYSVSLTANTLNRLYGKLKDNLFKPLMKDYYVLRLMDSACVAGRFDEMMAYLFSDEGDAETYAYAIGELTRYRDTVYPAINDMLQAIRDQGKNLIIMADYGGMQYPVSEESLYLGDSQVGLKSQSLGATVSRIDGRLSADYIAQQEGKGLARYISPDKKVDASTCRFPDNTFFISNIDHTWSSYYTITELSLADIPNLTVDTAENLPQFLYWDDTAHKLVPLETVLPEEEEEPQQELSFFQKVLQFFRDLFGRIRAFFENLF